MTKRAYRRAEMASPLAMILVLIFPITAQAQEAGGEIVVTAQKRSERLQDVPIALTALNSNSLEDRNISNIEGLAFSVPSLTVTNSAGVSATNLITIRGIAGQPLPIGASNATAVYLDGVYIARPDGAVFALDDVERVEVLRGPQGTLYGRNATAGAINIITRSPGENLQGGASLRYGNYNTLEAKASLSGPLASGFFAGVSGSYSRHDGYYNNSVDNRRVKGAESFTLRGTLRYASSDGSLEIKLSADTSRVDNPSFLKAIAPGSSAPSFTDPGTVAADRPNDIRQHVAQDGVALAISYDATETVKLTSITSYRKLNTQTVLDSDGTALPTALAAIDNTSKSFMQELRANYDGSGWRLTAGANYYHEDATLARAANPASLAVLRDPYDTSVLNAWALFAQAEIDLTRQLTVVGGLRFNSERRTFSLDYTARNPSFFYAGKVADDAWIPSIGLNFKPSSDLLIYAKVSKGYQAPGFEYSPGPTAGVRTFQAEDLVAYEAGLKTRMFGRRVTLDLAAFHYDYKDIQVRSNIGFGVTAVQNAASAKIDGVEASVTARPINALTIGGNLAYLDARYGDFCQPISAGTPQGADPLCAPNIADRSGNRLNQAPQWSGNVFATVELPTGNFGTLRGTVNYAWQGNVFYSTANIAPISSGGWNALDARLGLSIVNGPELFVYGKNLTNKRYVSWSAQATATILAGSLNEPRIYGVGISHRF